MSSRLAETLSSLGRTSNATLLDGWSNPDGALYALAGAGIGSTESLVLKLTPPAHDGASGDFAPLPQAPIFAGVSRASAELELTSGAERVSRVLVTTESRAWGSGTTPFSKLAAEILLVLDSDRQLSFAGAISDDEESVKAIVAPLAQALAAFLDVPLEGVSEAPSEIEPSVASPLAASAVARFSIGFEGEHLVLRDHESRGPRDGAARYSNIAYACLLPSLASFAAFAWGLEAYIADTNAGIGWVLGPLSLGVVLGVAAFAFFGVARYAKSYTAESAPLAWFCDDRLVVAPWASREGAIDTRPEGRFGAAIRTNEVSGASVRERDHRHAVVLETAHGPIEVLDTDDASVANHFAGLAERAIRSVASPEKKRTALQRAHQRREKRSPAGST